MLSFLVRFFFLVVYGRVFIASLLFPFLFFPNGHLSCFANVGAKETCPVGSRGKMIEDAKARKKQKIKHWVLERTGRKERERREEGIVGMSEGR